MYSSELDLSLWQGRLDASPDEYVFQQVTPLSLNKTITLNNHQQTPTALLGFKSDEGVRRNLGRVGAIEGPDAFRRAFSRLPLQSNQPITLYDAGNVHCKDGQLENAQTVLGDKVAEMLNAGLKTLVVGGGHETAWGHFQGIVKFFKERQLDLNKLAILNFDAHFDCRPLVKGKLGSSGTPFYQANELLFSEKKAFNYFCAGIQPLANTRQLFNYAKQHSIHYLQAESIRVSPLNTNFVEYIIDQYDFIYVTICLDVFHASVAPGVSAPQVLGIYPDFVIRSLKKLRHSGKVVSLDIVELSPKYDPDGRTANLAGQLAAEYLL